MSAVRIANCSGFYGDRHGAAAEMVGGGPIDVLTGDYLAELTMTILWKGRLKDPSRGWAATFLTQMEQVLGPCLDRGIKVVTNAGGLNPAGLAAALRQLAERLGLVPAVAHVEGDDLLPRLADLQAAGHDLAHLDTGAPLATLAATPVTANAYLGAWGIVEALRRGADVVVCGRVTDAALTVGPAAWHHGWARDDYDALAGATVAGHILECGAQATGGNYAFLTEVPGLEHPGFPLAEVDADGGSTITKHPGTGGLVSVGTVTAQLLYEIDGPRYLTPDVVARFDTVRLAQDGPDRVRVTGTRGEPPPPTTKVGITYAPGFRNTANLVLTGLDIEAKAAVAERALLERLGGRDRFAQVDVRLLRTDQPDPPSNEAASATLRITVKDPDPAKVGKAFSRAVVELALASYPGFHAAELPGDGSAYAVFWPALLPSDLIEQVVVLDDGTRVPIPPVAGPPPARPAPAAPPHAPPPDHQPDGRPGGADPATRPAPLGSAFGARSGDKAGNANLGVWARDDAGYAWLATHLTPERLRQLLPEARGLDVHRWCLPNLRAVNFVLAGLLGDGVAASTRPDPQAKSLGEYLRAKVVDLPASLLPAPAAPPRPGRDRPAATGTRLRHGFTDVDAQPRPAGWVQVLDRVGGEPFYAAYKRRIRQLLRPRPGGSYLDVGAGTGADAIRLAAETGATVVGVDRAHTMLATARDRGLRRVAAADAHRLPFPDGCFDGAWADRVLQHLTDPHQALDELIRVVAPGGRLVLADPDYDTQVLDLPDQELARRVLGFRADRMLRNGTIAHRQAGLLADRGLIAVEVEAPTLVVRDPTAVDNVMGLRSWAQTAADHGVLTPAEVRAWTAQVDRSIAEGRFAYAVTFFLTAATTPS